jgi:DNA-binding protein H-NS
MSNYAELQAQIAELKRKANTARRAEIDGAVKEIRALMEAHSLTIVDLEGKGKRRDRPVSPVPPKYRDPVSGATWTGRGRAPLWLNGRSKEDFVIS